MLDGDRIAADLTLMACGHRPRVDLAEAAGLTVGEGKVVVDAQMRTSLPWIYAVGDIAAAVNVAAGRRLAVEHWGDAENMGTVAGTVAAGANAAWTDVPGFWTDVGGRTLKYAAWGDGYDSVTVANGADGAFVARYRSGDELVGVLTYHDDEAYDAAPGLLTGSS